MSRSRIHRKTRRAITRTIEKKLRDRSAPRHASKRTPTGAPLDPAYRERNRLLRQMGFPTYADYLKSLLYQKIRQRALDLHGYHCEVCGALADELHHSDYSEETLKGANLSGLVPLCEADHKTVEMTRSGKKRSLEEANRTLEAMLLKKL